MGEAVRIQMRNRLRSFVDLPQFILGWEIGHLTLRKLTYLELGQNVFVCDGDAREPNDARIKADAIKFFWVCATCYEPPMTWRARRAMKRFEKSLSLFSTETLCLNVCEFLNETFMEDGYFARGVRGSEKNRKPVPRNCAAAYYVALLAKEFGWTEAAILDLPMRRILQYANQIYMRNIPDFEPPSLALHLQLKMLRKERCYG